MGQLIILDTFRASRRSTYSVTEEAIARLSQIGLWADVGADALRKMNAKAVVSVEDVERQLEEQRVKLEALVAGLPGGERLS